MKAFFYLILIAGIGNTVLRPEIGNPLTLYRILAPLGFLAFFTCRPALFFKLSACFLAFFLYNFVLASLYSLDYSQFFPSIVHYFYIFILLALMIYLKGAQKDFDKSFIQFIVWFYVFLLVNLFVELVAGPYYPNLYVDETGESILRAFFWNQNDLAVVLCVVGWFALALDRFKGPVRTGVAILTVLILYYNDSKAALLSFLFISIPALFIFRLVNSSRIARRVWLILGGCLFFFALAMLIAVSGIEIKFANDTYSLGDLLVKPILNIIRLQPSGEQWGSLNNRTDAAIFVIIEYLKSYGLGLGAGGSWLVLTLPQYELGGAKSPHNALLQFVVDFGYPVLLTYIYAVWWALRRLFTRNTSESDRLKVIAILSLPMLGLSQSGAIVTNYLFWAAIFFIWLFGRNSPFPLKHPLKTRKSGAITPAAIIHSTL